MLRLLVPLTWVLVLVTAAPTLAQDPDVILDPDSPSAKEYAIPFESARREAAGGERIVAGTGTRRAAGPLFGVGVEFRTPERPRAQPETRAERPRRSVGRDRSPAEEPDATRRSRTLAAPRRDAAVPDGDIGGAVALGAAGAAGLALAAAASLLLRRRRQ